MGILTDISSYLLNESWQMALVVLLIAGVSRLLRNSSAHVRYLLWLVVPARCLLPALYVVPVEILPPERVVSVEAGFCASSAEVVDVYESKPAATPVSPPVSGLRPGVASRVQRASRMTVGQWFGLLWLGGVVLFGLAGLLKALRTGRRLRRGRKLPPVELQRAVEEYFRGLGVKRMPEMWFVEGLGQPFVWGLLRGSVYLPGRFARSDRDKEFEAVLGHELSHVLRFDAAVNLAQIIAQGIYWFHPFVWWANKIIRTEREKCCDETAIARSNADPEDYSMAIINTLIAEHEEALTVPSLAIAGPVGNIEDRVKTIVKRGKKFRRRPRFAAIVAVLLLAAFVVPTGLALSSRAKAAEGPFADKWAAADSIDKEAALPGSTVRLEDAVRDERVFVAVCEALGQAHVMSEEAQVFRAVQKFKIVQTVTRRIPVFNKVSISYAFAATATLHERAIAKGERVIWVFSGAEGDYKGVKALAETPQNRAAVAGLSWGGPVVNGLQGRLEVKDIAEGPEPTATLIVRLRNVGTEPIRIVSLSAQKQFWGPCVPVEVRFGKRVLRYEGPAAELPSRLPATAYVDLEPGDIDSAQVVMFARYWGLERPFGAEVTFVFEGPGESEIGEYEANRKDVAPGRYAAGLWRGRLHSNTVRLHKLRLAAPQARTSSQVYEVLDGMVDLSQLRPQTPLAEALEQVKNAVEPPLVLIVLWNDLMRNADVERSTPVNMDPVSGVRLGTALEMLLASVSAGDMEVGYVVKDGVIIIATRGNLPKNFETRVYDISSMVLPGFYRGYGGFGGYTRSGGRGAGPGGYGGGAAVAEPAAGLTYSKAEDIRKLITETVEPDSWVEYGGFGRVEVVNGGRSLVISQGAKAHERIADRLNEMGCLAETIVSVGSRLIFMPVADTLLHAFLEEQGLEFEALADDPNTAYCFIDSSQARQLKELVAEVADSGMLTAPKVNVMNGDTATLSFIRARFTSSPSGWFGVSSSPLLTGVGANCVSLVITPTFDEEQNEIFLDLHFELGDKAGDGAYVTEMPTPDGGVVGHEFPWPCVNHIWSIGTRLAVPDGKSVLISAGQFYTEEADKELFLLIEAEKLKDANVAVHAPEQRPALPNPPR